jgi:hypothetical protein
MKPFIVLQGPVATRSGYGNHTRDLALSLLKTDKYDVQIVSLPWGNTPMNALEANNEDHKLIDRHIARANITRKPDVFIQVSVANEFQPLGKYNIGITAGVETNQVPHEFLQGANRMDLILATSEFTKKGFLDTVYDQVDEKTKQKTGELKLETPIEVLFEGADLNVYKKIKSIDIDTDINHELSAIDTDFNFLFVGHWLKGDFGQDRKDVAMMIRTFCEAFKNKSTKNKPGLIIKTSHATFSIMDREETIRKIQQLTESYGVKAPKIYLLHGDLTDNQMNSLYNHPKVKAMLSFTKGEGFGRPLLEFTLSEKPVLASQCSGQQDFLKHAHPLVGDETEVHKSATDKFILPGSKWFTVNYVYAANTLRDCVANYKNYLKAAKRQAYFSKTEFSFDAMSSKFCEYVDTAINSVPQQVELKLPKLKSANDTEQPKLKLPKLKKINS